jgi:ribosomal protein L27
MAVLVALLVVFAGCTGGGASDAPVGGNGGSSGGGSSGGGGSDGGGSDGASSDDVEVVDAERALRDAGSFTSSWTFTMVDADGAESSTTHSFAVDLEANRTMESLSTAGERAGASYERFTADGTSYTRFGEGEEVFYQVVPVADDPVASALARGAAFTYDDLSDARRVGTETFDGVSVDRYEYTDPMLWRQYGTTAFGTEENVTVTDFTLVALVDGDGLARSTGWTLTGETEDGRTVTAEWRFEVTDVGSTTVADPDWLDEASTAGQAPSG